MEHVIVMLNQRILLLVTRLQVILFACLEEMAFGEVWFVRKVPMGLKIIPPKSQLPAASPILCPWQAPIYKWWSGGTTTGTKGGRCRKASRLLWGLYTAYRWEDRKCGGMKKVRSSSVMHFDYCTLQAVFECTVSIYYIEYSMFVCNALQCHELPDDMGKKRQLAIAGHLCACLLVWWLVMSRLWCIVVFSDVTHVPQHEVTFTCFCSVAKDIDKRRPVWNHENETVVCSRHSLPHWFWHWKVRMKSSKQTKKHVISNVS